MVQTVLLIFQIFSYILSLFIFFTSEVQKSIMLRYISTVVTFKGHGVTPPVSCHRCLKSSLGEPRYGYGVKQRLRCVSTEGLIPEVHTRIPSPVLSRSPKGRQRKCVAQHRNTSVLRCCGCHGRGNCLPSGDIQDNMNAKIMKI